MNISGPFIARPIATGLLAVAVLLAGLLGYSALPVSALPQVDFPTIEVSTQLPGANAEVTATLITASLERQFGEITGLSSMESTSSEGTSQITLQFNLSRSMDGAAQDVQAAINAAAGTLPSTLPYPPSLCEGEPGRRADRDAWRSPRTVCRSTPWRTPPTPCCSRSSARSTAWAR